MGDLEYSQGSSLVVHPPPPFFVYMLIMHIKGSAVLNYIANRSTFIVLVHRNSSIS